MKLIPVWRMGAECRHVPVVLHGDAAQRGSWFLAVEPLSVGEILSWMELPSMSWLKWWRARPPCYVIWEKGGQCLLPHSMP
jgi:hypothetical protein